MLPDVIWVFPELFLVIDVSPSVDAVGYTVKGGKRKCTRLREIAAATAEIDGAANKGGVNRGLGYAGE